MKPTFAFAVLMCAAPMLFADPKISFKDPVPPANNTRVFAQRCPGELCIENCVFDLSALVSAVKIESSIFFRDLEECTVKLLNSDGTTLVSTNLSLSGTNAEVKPSWTGTKEVACDSRETLQLQVTAREVEYDVTPQGTNSNYFYATKTLDFLLHCVDCSTGTRTEGNGKTKVEQSTESQNVRLGCVIANLTMETGEVEFVVTSESGWLVLTPPSPLQLADGESHELFLDVVVPANTPDGSVEKITVTSTLAGQPDSVSSTTMEVELQTPIRLWVAEFDPDGIVHLQVSGPWNTDCLVEWSEDLRTWEILATVHALPGTLFTEVPDPGPRKGNSRFYRARIQSPSDAARSK